MARKKKGGHGGGHGWFVTFADLMGLMMSFFVMVAAYSSQDKVKMQQLAGSMREAFGQQPDPRLAGMLEIGGLPTRTHPRYLSPISGPDSSGAQIDAEGARTQGPANVRSDGERTPSERDRAFSTAAATLRQAWQALPEVAALSQNILLADTPEGLAIQIVDEDGRAMFPEGSRYPYERTRLALQALGPVLARLPNQVSITGHTAAVPAGRSSISPWDLSAERANTVRRILMESGLASDRISGVTGRADAEPLMPANPAATANSRVTILLQHRAPPVPAGMRP
jgi:chemotaxis protein MotB